MFIGLETPFLYHWRHQIHNRTSHFWVPPKTSEWLTSEKHEEHSHFSNIWYLDFQLCSYWKKAIYLCETMRSLTDKRRYFLSIHEDQKNYKHAFEAVDLTLYIKWYWSHKLNYICSKHPHSMQIKRWTHIKDNEGNTNDKTLWLQPSYLWIKQDVSLCFSIFGHKISRTGPQCIHIPLCRCLIWLFWMSLNDNIYD